jgi:hypothetical protein
MGVEINGIDDLENTLEEMIEDVLDLGQTSEVPFDELFPPQFMSLYTEFNSFDELLEESPWEVNTEADFEAIPDDAFDEYIEANTDFPEWELMVETGFDRYVERKFS